MKSEIEILFEDEVLLAVNKPAGVTVIPERFAKEKNSLQQLLEPAHGKLFVVHRLDRDTTGVLLFAKTEAAHKHLSLQFQNHTVRKWYKTIVQGRMPEMAGEIDAPIAENMAHLGTMIVQPRGKPSLTLFEVDELFAHHSLLTVELKTGRTHQIRVHLASAGYPLLVDEIYAKRAAFYFSSLKKKYKHGEEEERPTLARLSLHAWKIEIEHPAPKTKIQNPRFEITAPLPKDLETVLKLLRKWDV